MSYTTLKITITAGTDVNTFGRLIRDVLESDATERIDVEVD